MDIPTLIILCSLAASAALFVAVWASRVSRKRALAILFASIGALWLSLTVFGEFIFGAGNSTCSKLLGCVEGFAGYDAFEHMFFGIVAALAIVWLCEHFPKHSILHDKRWKSVLTVIAIVALASVVWEMAECAHDAIRIDILHEHLRGFHLNLLDQPTNLDTMGDLTFALLGGFIGLFMERRIRSL